MNIGDTVIIQNFNCIGDGKVGHIEDIKEYEGNLGYIYLVRHTLNNAYWYKKEHLRHPNNEE